MGFFALASILLREEGEMPAGCFESIDKRFFVAWRCFFLSLDGKKFSRDYMIKLEESKCLEIIQGLSTKRAVLCNNQLTTG